MIMFGKKYSCLLLMPILFIASHDVFAQTSSGDSWLNRVNSAYVKSLEEFSRRFNSEEFHPDIESNKEDNLRERSLLTLFDWQLFNAEDSNISKLIMEFVDSVCWNEIRLNIKDKGLYAEARCSFMWKQREIPINIVLVYENIRDNIYEWAVAGANGLVENDMLDTNYKGYIEPVEHEFSFGILSKACDDDLTKYISVEKSVDQLSFLLGMLKTRQLRFVSCDNVSFHFVQIPGFVIVVDKKIRFNLNSGYLIGRLLKFNEQSKECYIKKLLGI